MNERRSPVARDVLVAISGLPEIFAAPYRTTGVDVAYNLGSVLAGAIPPLLAACRSYAIGNILAVYAVVATVAVRLLCDPEYVAVDRRRRRTGIEVTPARRTPTAPG